MEGICEIFRRTVHQPFQALVAYNAHRLMFFVDTRIFCFTIVLAKRTLPPFQGFHDGSHLCTRPKGNPTGAKGRAPCAALRRGECTALYAPRRATQSKLVERAPVLGRVDVCTEELLSPRSTFVQKCKRQQVLVSKVEVIMRESLGNLQLLRGPRCRTSRLTFRRAEAGV